MHLCNQKKRQQAMLIICVEKKRSHSIKRPTLLWSMIESLRILRDQRVASVSDWLFLATQHA
jgi:hypothetical protein